MSMGEKLEGQCLSRAFQGWLEISSSVTPALHMAKHGHISPDTPRLPCLRKSPFFSCCFSNWNVEPVLPGSFRVKVGLGTEAKGNQHKTVQHWIMQEGLGYVTGTNNFQSLALKNDEGYFLCTLHAHRVGMEWKDRCLFHIVFSQGPRLRVPLHWAAIVGS